ncbi:hypothetical protein [Amphritea balenae]|uniref:Uncharacterized protein n=1 Tax=Amphritea balenae TaxID=452629 RepID=A0A3P1SR99_9GAMM|nr:hypothetical protein [Amphritea balenae]RRC99677.1 hypothetical protein EHS89_09305 [Amphritea balenae]GGK78914.1 hypothetical protein GCM10007941_31440 [Amphritea balenae]
MQIERIEQQIESYTSSLTHAVNEGRGAQFSMLLSLINNAEGLVQKKAQASSTEFRLPEEEGLQYPDPDSLYSEELVGRLNRSVTETQQGEFAYLLSHLESRSASPVNVQLNQDYFAKVGLASAGRLMLDEIDRSGQQFSAQA